MLYLRRVRNKIISIELIVVAKVFYKLLIRVSAVEALVIKS